MTLEELLAEVKSLSRSEKIRLMHFLVVDLAEQEGVSLLAPNVEYPIWTPLNSFEAAEALANFLETEKHKA